jgi:hypothetical protein
MEDTLSGIDAYLTATLQAEIDAIEIERAVVIPDLVTVETTRNKDRGYPYLEVRPGKITYEYGSETEPLASDPVEIHEATVAIRHTGSEVEAVQLVLCRYLEALRRASLDDNTYGGRFNWARIEEADFARVTDAQDRGKLVQELRARLRVEVMR